MDNCSDLQTDAVPDRPRPNSSKPCSHSYESKFDSLESSLGLSHDTKPSHRPKQTPKRDNKPSRPSGTKPNIPKQSSMSQPEGVQHVTYNISNSKDVQIGNKYTISIGSTDTTNSKPQYFGKQTMEIKKLCQSVEPVMLDDITLVSTHLGSSWKEVGRCLNYSNGHLQQFEVDHGREGLKEVIYQLLLDWKQSNGSGATVGILGSALWTSKQYDVIKDWMKVRT